MSENLRNFTKAVFAVDAVVNRMPAEAWDNQSPCPDWTARQVLGHVIWGLKNLTARVDGGGPPPDRDEADLAGPDPAATWGPVRDAALAALDRPGVLQTVIETPFGAMPVDQFLGFFALDPQAHAWDIARSADLDPALPDDLAAIGCAQLATAGELLRGAGALGPPIEVSSDADVVSRFLAISGRDPRR